jgi:hypothetical protein
MQCNTMQNGSDCDAIDALQSTMVIPLHTGENPANPPNLVLGTHSG